MQQCKELMKVMSDSHSERGLSSLKFLLLDHAWRPLRSLESWSPGEAG